MYNQKQEIMKKSILQIKGMEVLSKEHQRNIKGAASGGNTGKCGCDCAGNVTGPYYCQLYFACPQIYTC